jgi:hypothetical protein
MMERYKYYFEIRHIHLMLLIVLNATTIYFRKIPLPRPASNPEILIAACQRRGIDAPDLLHEFGRYANQEMLYQRDDIHWGPVGIFRAARFIAPRVRQTSKRD